MTLWEKTNIKCWLLAEREWKIKQNRKEEGNLVNKYLWCILEVFLLQISKISGLVVNIFPLNMLYIAYS